MGLSLSFVDWNSLFYSSRYTLITQRRPELNVKILITHCSSSLANFRSTHFYSSLEDAPSSSPSRLQAPSTHSSPVHSSLPHNPAHLSLLTSSLHRLLLPSLHRQSENSSMPVIRIRFLFLFSYRDIRSILEIQPRPSTVPQTQESSGKHI